MLSARLRAVTTTSSSVKPWAFAGTAGITAATINPANIALAETM
jgi:hypothetical protein